MTVFKKIIDKKLPTDIVYEDDLCLAFKDRTPQAPGYFSNSQKRNSCHG